MFSLVDLLFEQKRVSFARYKFSDIVNAGWKVPPTWHMLTEDLSLDLLGKGDFPGVLLFSLRAGLARTVPATPDPICRPLKANESIKEVCQCVL